MTLTLQPDPLALELVADLERRLQAVAAQELYQARLKRTAELLGNQHVLVELQAKEQQLAATRRALESERQALLQPSPAPVNGFAVPPAILLPETPAAPPLPERRGPTYVERPLPPPAPDRVPRGRSGPPQVTRPLPPPVALPARAAPPAPVPLPVRSEPAAPAPAAPEPAPVVPPPGARPPIVVGPPVAPTWHPRPLAELEEDRELVELWLDDHPAIDPARHEPLLIELSAWGCTFRRAARERTKHPGSQDEWRQTLRRLLKFKVAHFMPDVVIALNERIEADPALWAERASAYHAAVPAVQALHWLETLSESRRERLGPDVAPLLESITAAFHLLIRAVEVRSEDPREVKAREMERRALAVADGFDYQPHCRHRSRSTESLKEEREALEGRWTEIRLRLDVGERRDQIAQELAALTGQPDFGEADWQRLALLDACTRLLAAGEQPSSPRLVNTVHPHRAYLAGVKGLETLHRQCQLKEEREALGEGLEPEGQVTITSELRAKIQALLPLTRGKVFLMMGGADDGRGSRLKALLQFEECRWPALSPGQRDPGRVEREIGRRDVDFVGVNRFNSVHIDAYKKLCRRYEKTMIVIPRGLGVVQVIECMYQQRVLRHAPEGTLVAV